MSLENVNVNRVYLEFDDGTEVEGAELSVTIPVSQLDNVSTGAATVRVSESDYVLVVTGWKSDEVATMASNSTKRDAIANGIKNAALSVS